MTLAVLLLCLTVVIVYKASVGEGTANFLNEVTGDPNLALPPSASEREVPVLRPDAAGVDAAVKPGG